VKYSKITRIGDHRSRIAHSSHAELTNLSSYMKFV